MKRILKILLMISLGWMLYTFIFGVLIFNAPIIGASDIDYDVDALLERDEEVAGTYATVVDENVFALDSRLAIIESASDAIDISYYTIHDGFSRDVVFHALLEAADRDVSVRVIIDAVFYPQTFRDEDALNALASHENVTFKFYEPYNPLLPHTMQNRLHDKLLVADGVYGMSGGRNIGNRFFMPGEEGGYSSTNDRDILIHSEDGPHPTVERMHDYYDELFDHPYTTRYDPDSGTDSTDVLQRMREAFETYSEDYDRETTLARIDSQKREVDNATFVHGPISRMHKDPVVYETVVEIAKRSDRWFIQSPYIIFSNLMKDRFPDTEGKDITILTNNMADNTNVMAVSGYRRYRLPMAREASLYEYQGAMTIHAKTMTFDDDISVIGSFNLDPRSASLSTESVIVVVSEDFQAALHDVVGTYMDESLEVSDEGEYVEDDAITPALMSDRRKWVLRVLGAMTYFFDPML